MRLRYRPSFNLIVIGSLAVALVLFNLVLLQPRRDTLHERHAALSAELARIQQQQSETVTAADKKLLAQMRWTGADWTQATVIAMNEAQARTPKVKATYALGTAAPVTLTDGVYSAMRIDLEMQAEDDPSIMRFIDGLVTSLPGAATITALQLQAAGGPGPVTGIMSVTLYRAVGL